MDKIINLKEYLDVKWNSFQFWDLPMTRREHINRMVSFNHRLEFDEHMRAFDSALKTERDFMDDLWTS